MRVPGGARRGNPALSPTSSVLGRPMSDLCAEPSARGAVVSGRNPRRAHAAGTMMAAALACSFGCAFWSPEAVADRTARQDARKARADAWKQESELRRAAAADHDLTRRVRFVVTPRINLGGGGDGDMGEFALYYGPPVGGGVMLLPPLPSGVGVSAGLRFGGRFGLMMDFDWMIGYVDRGASTWESCSFAERSVQGAAYLPLGRSGRRDEIVVGARYVYDATLLLGSGDSGWEDGSGFGLDLAYCWRMFRPFSASLGLRLDWLKFGEYKDSGVRYSVSDRTHLLYFHASGEFRF